VQSLAGSVAVVTGASRGIGRGVGIGLGEAGATVYVTGRNIEELESTAAAVTAAGGLGVPVLCDHRHDDEVDALFDRVAAEHGRLDLLVNNATAAPDVATLFSEAPFWTLPVSMWDNLFAVGLRSHFVAARRAAMLMVPRQSGLIVNISSAGAIARIGAILPYGVVKTAVDRMTRDMAEDLRGHGVTVLSLWPPPTSTPGMLAAVGPEDDVTAWSLPEFTGRVVAALARSEHFERSGTAVRVRELAAELGVTDARYEG
jgi:NAD(P)-dependent dehydrogenase (short-subunit alcohol dehydrogenase family)